ncbi:hypothetical protein WH299_01935 [Pseudomonas sp. MYb541]|uniref:DUF4625 domain-containing protein n=2 Tax=Pseudomonas TaxID=286 RepID=A0A423FFS1_9PSED|nr:hypothetical protein [Pseudomonas canadensis]MEB2646808.1 hypothetical protein [Pseudomonas canadensis]ROM56301.1 hypothetical protein BK649_04895 [Pseudomonas canadensis]WLH28592.1 hypothetical protein PSH56_21425 [Pseudomonas canadensis]WNJ83928.1 hypothetical protein RMQ99_22860 [Pseudomonas canadensis]WRI23393.1 hypothetical protein SPL95_22705 [Pseudomonas canadensis]
MMKLGKLAGVMVGIAALSACDDGKVENVFSAQYSASSSSLDVAAGSKFAVPITVKNTSSGTWDSKASKAPVLASYHWLNADKTVLLLDGNRTPFAQPVKPDSEVAVQLGVVAPKAPGNYILQVSLVKEGAGWFEAKNVKPLELAVKVK